VGAFSSAEALSGGGFVLLRRLLVRRAAAFATFLLVGGFRPLAARITGAHACRPDQQTSPVPCRPCQDSEGQFLF
jgi:hypothetical protein